MNEKLITAYEQDAGQIAGYTKSVCVILAKCPKRLIPLVITCVAGILGEIEEGVEK